LIGYYLPDIQLSQRGRIEKISIKVAGSIYRACEQARGAVVQLYFRIILRDIAKKLASLDKTHYQSLLTQYSSMVREAVYSL
jgi:hypothetical protein